MESENIEEVIQEGIQEDIQEGGAVFQPNDRVNFSPVSKTFQQIWNTALSFDSLARPNLFNFTINGSNYTDRPLLLSDLASLMVTGRPGNIPLRTHIQDLFDSVPLAQYKHLPDPSYFSASGGSERTLETQEVSLPSNEEVLPSLDIVEPTSIGGSYKRSSHKKRKSTRIRTKKNKKL